MQLKIAFLGGVHPEDLAAGISRLSVIEEGVGHAVEETQQEHIKHLTPQTSSRSISTSSQPDLSHYFGASGGALQPSSTASASENQVGTNAVSPS